MKRIVLLLLMILLTRLTGLAQNVAEPPEGKAIVHIVFDESIPSGDALLYLNDSLIGGFGRNEYTSLVVEPGRHTLRAWNKGPALMEAEVVANRMYLVLVEGSRNDNAFPIRFDPVKDGSTRFWQVKRLINANPPTQGTQEVSLQNIDQHSANEIPPAKIARLTRDMHIGKKSFEVPPISH